MERTPFIIGNWKMHKTTSETKAYIDTLAPLIHGVDVTVGLSVPFTLIQVAKLHARDTEIQIGAQDVSEYLEGAFTGEISALQLKDVGASFVLVGHSERRQHHHENNYTVRNKVEQAIKRGLHPVLCIGETLKEREDGLTHGVLQKQIEEGLKGLTDHEASCVILAYEPVWAIGTGKSASASVANDAHAFCRKCLGQLFSSQVAFAISILYGGSVNTDNIESLMKEKDIDGALVGGASLDAMTFAKLIKLSRN